MRAWVGLAAAAALAARGEAQVITRTAGSVVMRVDLAEARPGGVIDASVSSPRTRLSAAFAILQGRRIPQLANGSESRALVPVPLGTPSGPDVLGFELWVRNRRQRIPVEIEIGAGPDSGAEAGPTRVVAAANPARQARELLQLLRVETPAAIGLLPFRSPLNRPRVAAFGAAPPWSGNAAAESAMDGFFGSRHRGIDFDGAGGIVVAPAAGLVLFVGSGPLTGGAVVLDHGRGIVSLLAHLARIDAAQGESVEAGKALGLASEAGALAAAPTHWGIYLHGVPVDPAVFERLAETASAQ